MSIFDNNNNSINLFKPLYNRLEQDLIEVTNYIHISKNNMKVNSIINADLILRTVSEIENIAKAICDKEKIVFYEYKKDKKTKRKKRIKRSNVKLHEYLDQLDSIYSLNKKEVKLSYNNFHLLDDNLICPFERNRKGGGEEREWHFANNKLKHGRQKNFKHASLENVIHSLAGLFLLNIYYENECYDENLIQTEDEWIPTYLQNEKIKRNFAVYEFIHNKVVFESERFMMDGIMGVFEGKKPEDFNKEKYRKIHSHYCQIIRNN